jgi:hypothetical protein
MKGALVKILNQKDHINLEEIITLVIAYSKNKVTAEVEKLKKIVQKL